MQVTQAVFQIACAMTKWYNSKLDDQNGHEWLNCLDHMTNLFNASTQMGITLSTLQQEQLDRYYAQLIDWNHQVNLTRIVTRQDVIVKHFLDSLSCLTIISPLPATVIDVGTGAGFPGLVLKIAQPNIQLTLVESTQKKVDFLNHIIQTLGLSHTDVIAGRAEIIGHQAKHRECYHLAIARAVAPLPVLAEYLLPLVQVDGYMLAQKGASADKELDAATQAIDQLGGQHIETKSVSIPNLDATRNLVLIRKVNSTPERYPRRPGIPAKRPIKNV